MTRIIAEILDLNYTKLGSGPVDVVSCSITRPLDRAGSFEATLALTNKRNIDLIANERRVRFLTIMNNGTKLTIGVGVIQDVTMSEDSSKAELKIEGLDEMVELARKSVLLGRTYDTQNLSAVVTAITTIAGWGCTYIGSDATITLKLDGISVLNALAKIAEETGTHFRQSGTRAIEFGVLGDVADLVALKIPGNSPRLGQNARLLPIERMTVTYNSADLANWILPLGKGTGTSSLTLQNATKTAPYAIRTITLPDATTGYYLVDDTSVAQLGQIERVMKFDIQAIDATPANVAKAADALYDATVTELQRMKQKQITYDLKCQRGTSQVVPGTKIRVIYKGIAQKSDGQYTYLDVDEYLWVLSVKEGYSANGLTLDITVSNVDQHPRNGAVKVADMLESLEISKIVGF